MPMQFDPPSGTRDFLAADVEARERAFATIRSVFARYGFEPLQTPAFERLDVLLGKYGEEGDKLIFKILRRGEHEATGEADLALRYDLTVPLARELAAVGRGDPGQRHGQVVAQGQVGLAGCLMLTAPQDLEHELVAVVPVLAHEHVEALE